MPSTKRYFRPVTTVEQERKLPEERFPTSSSTKWPFKIFKERKIRRVNKDASLDNVQSFDTNTINMTAESPTQWFTKFVQEPSLYKRFANQIETGTLLEPCIVFFVFFFLRILHIALCCYFFPVFGSL